MQIVIDIAIFLVSAIIFTFVGMAIRKKVAESKLGSAEEEARNVRVHKLLLQPFVENAINWGVGQKEDGGTV